MRLFNKAEVLKSQPLDFKLLQNGSINIYIRPEFLQEDRNWLKEHDYKVYEFDCKLWADKAFMHNDLKLKLGFPDYYGKNLDALNDCMYSINDVDETSGAVLVFYNFDSFTKLDIKYAFNFLDILELQSRYHLLFGFKIITLIQTNDAKKTFFPLGSRSSVWNSREWSYKSRGIDSEEVIGKEFI